MSSGTVAHDAEAALAHSRVGAKKPQDREARRRWCDAELIEHSAGIPEIRLAHGDAAPTCGQLLAREFDRLGILVEGQNIGARFPKRFGMATTTAGAINDEGARASARVIPPLPSREPDGDS